MTVESLMTRPAKLVSVTDGGEDAYGNPTETETETSVLCEMQQVQRSESPNPDSWQVGTYWLFLSVATDVAGVDRLEMDGDIFDFQGPPSKVWNPRTASFSHWQATVVRRT